MSQLTTKTDHGLISLVIIGDCEYRHSDFGLEIVRA